MSRVVHDEGAPNQIALHLRNHDVESVRTLGFKGTKNGKLLDAIEALGFDAFISNDKRLEFDQNLSRRPFSVLLPSTNHQDNMPLDKNRDYPRDAYVGPYWLVCDDSGKVRLIAHRCSLVDAEEYGDYVTCPHGHYDLWEEWRIGSASDRLTSIVRDAEYEEWPRGRVVFNFVQRRFTVYGDPQVFKYELQNLVTEHFGIPAEGDVEFAEDGHYQSTRSLRQRPERSRQPSGEQIM